MNLSKKQAILYASLSYSILFVMIAYSFGFWAFGLFLVIIPDVILSQKYYRLFKETNSFSK